MFICDCGQRYSKHDDLISCQNRSHQGSADLEAFEALADIPHELTDEWYEKHSELFKLTDYSNTCCADCKVETNHQKTDVAEWYMVKDEIWNKAMMATQPVDFLCIGCLEERIGRQLSPDDFNDAPLNGLPGFCRSERLQNRLGIDFQ